MLYESNVPAYRVLAKLLGHALSGRSSGARALRLKEALMHTQHADINNQAAGWHVLHEMLCVPSLRLYWLATAVLLELANIPEFGSR